MGLSQLNVRVMVTLFSIFMELILRPQVAMAQFPLPTVQMADFQVGRSWTWDYTEDDGKPYSTERYTVIEVNGSTVLIEIASDYGGGQNLKPNTRLRADVAKCLAASLNPLQKKPWSMTMFSLGAGGWSEFEAPSTLAFEEKFNCDPHVHLNPADPVRTETSMIDGMHVFQQKLLRGPGSSWFADSGPESAVAVKKEFTADPSMTYQFKLR